MHWAWGRTGIMVVKREIGFLLIGLQGSRWPSVALRGRQLRAGAPKERKARSADAGAGTW